MMRFFVFSWFMFLSWSISHGQFKNVRLDEKTEIIDHSSSVVINPKNPLNIVAACGDDLYSSSDGGKTWQKKKISSNFGFQGSPFLIADSKGTIYLFYRSSLAASQGPIVCQISTDGGSSWDSGNPVGLNPSKVEIRPNATIDSKGNLVLTWTDFDEYPKQKDSCQSVVMLSTSSNGKKWSKPVVISQDPGDCLDDDNTPSAASPAVSDDKKVYVAWAVRNNVYLDRSFDGGGMWLTNDIVVAEQKSGWSQKVSGHKRSNGWPVLSMDKSKTERNGLIYLAFTDQRNGNSDVLFTRSNNFGDNWSSPENIVDDPEKTHQYLPSMTSDRTTGNIYILFFHRPSNNEDLTEVHLAYSKDAGNTFKSVKVSEDSFMPEEKSGEGNQLSISANKGAVVMVWTRTDEEKISVMNCTIMDKELP